MEERRFDGVWIPSEIWLDDRLNALDKVILTEIHSLDKGDEHCWAGNDYLAQFCQCSTSKVTKTVSKLIDLGYVKVHSFDGRIRRLRSCITFCTSQNSKKYDSAEQNILPTNITNSLKDKHTPRKSATSVFTEGFDDFWAEYPRPVAKQKAREAWSKVKPDEGVRESILADVRRRKAGEWKDIEERYIPHPSTYLNQRRWEDEPERDREPEKSYGLYCENLSPEEFMRLQQEQAEKDREEARRQGLL